MQDAQEHQRNHKGKEPPEKISFEAMGNGSPLQWQAIHAQRSPFDPGHDPGKKQQDEKKNNLTGELHCGLHQWGRLNVAWFAPKMLRDQFGTEDKGEDHRKINQQPPSGAQAVVVRRAAGRHRVGDDDAVGRRDDAAREGIGVEDVAGVRRPGLVAVGVDHLQVVGADKQGHDQQEAEDRDTFDRRVHGPYLRSAGPGRSGRFMCSLLSSGSGRRTAGSACFGGSASVTASASSSSSSYGKTYASVISASSVSPGAGSAREGDAAATTWVGSAAEAIVASP